jgi:hypothetical protein
MMTTIRMIQYLPGTYSLVLNRPLNATDQPRHPLNLIHEDDLPSSMFIKRYRLSLQEAAGMSISKGAGDLAAIIYDEVNESPDDYLKYCLQFLDLPENADLKRWMQQMDDTGDYYTRWWLHPTEPNPAAFFGRLRYEGLCRNFDNLTEFIDLLYAVQRLLRDREEDTPLPPLPPGEEGRAMQIRPVLNIIT